LGLTRPIFKGIAKIVADDDREDGVDGGGQACFNDAGDGLTYLKDLANSPVAADPTNSGIARRADDPNPNGPSPWRLSGAGFLAQKQQCRVTRSGMNQKKDEQAG
jgi:hypothetical protein